MSGNRKCPICGSETERGAAFCPVCKADLNALPQEMFPLEQDSSPQEAAPAGNGLDLDSPIPEWMRRRFREKGKNKGGKLDYQSFEDALFASPAKSEASKPARPSRRAPKSTSAPADTVYQPPLDIEPPLVESDDKTEQKDVTDTTKLDDFSEIRPARKWDDPASAAALDNRIDEEFPTLEPDYSDMEKPLVEPEEGSERKNVSEDDPTLLNSVSPAKVRDAARYLDSYGNVVRSKMSAPAVPADHDDPPVSEDSLLSDLLKRMEEGDKPEDPQPAETVFFTGNETQDGTEEGTPAFNEIDLSGTEGNSALMLDRILRGNGYHVEGETTPAQEQTAVPEQSAPDVPAEEPVVEEAAETPAEETSEDRADAAPESSPVNDQPVQIKDDDSDDLDIPWDLFGSAEMDLPHSPADPAYSTFSRKGIPSDPGSTEYQQRMLSSVLKRIINAETFVRPLRKPNDRALSLAARIFWALLAVGGVMIILLTNLTDRITLEPDRTLSENAAAFAAAVSKTDNALLVVDYTPAYSAVLDASAGKLLASLRGNGCKVNAAVLDPAAMPTANRLLGADGADWWPAGVLSIRRQIAGGGLPQDVYLITANASSVRNWAEQLGAAGAGIRLHVMAAGQLETVTDAYLNAGLVADAISARDDLNIYGGGSEFEGRAGFAVLYLAILPFPAWLGGLIAKFLRKDPERGRRSAVSAAGSFGSPAPEKEASHEH